MSTQVQRRRGTTAQHAAFTGALGEVTVDTDKNVAIVHNAALAGGFPLAGTLFANIFEATQTINVPSAGPLFSLALQTAGTTRITFRKDGTGEFLRQEADVSQAGIEMLKRGTTGNATAALSSGSGIASVGWQGWDGAAFASAGHLRMFTSEAWTGIAHGSKLFFSTVPVGTTTAVVHATLDSTAFEVMSRLLLPNTTSATVGGIYFGGNRAFHNFGTNNIFAGVNAGNLTMTGTNNAFFGTSAGLANTTGTSNAFFGVSAGIANTTGVSNSFFGRYAGQANTTGSYNSFFGRSAGVANTTGSNSAFFGFSSGLSNTTGVSNSFFGRSAGQANTTGSYNSFFGRMAGAANTTGSNNSFVGAFTGAANTTGAFNSFFGRYAGQANTTGSYNSFFGANTGLVNTTGAANSFFGTSTGAANTTGVNNSFFGRSAGVANTTGNNNTLFGFAAGNNLTTGSNNIVLGYDIDSPTATNSNTLTIGNLIFGTGIDGTGVAISSGNIGIAVINPHSGLQVGRSFALPYRATAVTTTFLASDYTIDATGTFTVNLPTAVGITGRIYVLKNSGVGTITLDPDGAELIDGLATATIVSGASITTQSTGTGWIII